MFQFFFFQHFNRYIYYILPKKLSNKNVLIKACLFQHTKKLISKNIPTKLLSCSKAALNNMLILHCTTI